MRAGSLVVLCVIFCTAFIGRAAVLAASLVEEAPGEAESGEQNRGDQCINGALAAELKKEIDWIRKEKAGLADRKSAIDVLGQHLEKRTLQLEELNNSLAARLGENEASQEKNKAAVGAIYSQMKPAAASGIIGGMDPQFAAGLLLSMNEENASAILSALPPDRAYAITVLMARVDSAR